MNNFKLLTWLDVERKIKEHSNNKTEYIDEVGAIYCYANEMEIEYSGDIQNVINWLGDIFGRSFINEDSSYIKLDLGGDGYQVNFIKTTPESKNTSLVYPLWKEQVYSTSNSSVVPDEWSGGPNVVAFHSFKGGVGRTTALMTYASAILNSSEKSKILLIDADLEAPGISFWLDNTIPPTVSFINFLESIHYAPVKLDVVLDYFSSELKKTSINISGPNKEIFVLPASLNLTSIMDMPVTPEHISKNLENPWLLSDCLRELGKRLNVDAVFIDLRAGLSELASPILFDPRIEHFFVTTVAPQSVKGMSEVLKRIHQSHKYLPSQFKEIVKPSLIMSLLTSQLRELTIYSDSIELLNSSYQPNEDDMVTQGIEWLEADFVGSFMSLSSVKEAIEKLTSSSLYKYSLMWANSLREAKVTKPELVESKPLDHKENAKLIFETCDKFQFAENANTNDMLVTDPLRNLAKNYLDTLPNAVSIGAKGAGKTFTYLQVCRTGSWKEFIKKINNDATPTVDADIFPWMASTNIKDEIREEIRDIRLNLVSSLGLTANNNLNSGNQKIRSALETQGVNWDSFWIEFLLSEFDEGLSTLQQLNNWLVEKDKSILLLVDGIEDAFDAPEKSESQRDAIKSLLQLPNAIAEISNRRIGFICFVRADYVQNVMRQNQAQYISRFQQFKLEWTPETFLRLAYWICGKAGVIGANPADAETHNIDHLLLELENLWGKKLGRDNSKEANTARWVFAALCDLNGKLQARDLVRFLKFSADVMIKSQSNIIKPELWSDRILVPESIRRSLPLCSDEKVKEAANEIKPLNDWMSSLESISADYKKVPFNPLEVGLSLDLLSSLRDLGIIYEDTDQSSDDRYFLPEIYRYGLKFTSASGGRPRVQALLKRNLGGMPF
ncbi:KGGVGR-motif variant AAA ATPase [Yersinia enterocolitica]